MNIKRQHDSSKQNEDIEFKLDRKSKSTREKLSGKELKKGVEKDSRLIDRHRSTKG
jgi:hypothetical protein